MKKLFRASSFIKILAATAILAFSLSSCRLLAFSLLYGGGYGGDSTTVGSGSAGTGSSSGGSSGGTSTGTGSTGTGSSSSGKTGSSGTSSTGTGSSGTGSSGSGTSSSSGTSTTGTSSSTAGKKLPISNKALSWGDVLQFDSSYFANFAQGSKIIITAKNTDQWSSQFKMYAPVENTGWVPLSNGTVTNASLNGDGVITSNLGYNKSGQIIYTVTAQEAENLKKYGMYLHGGGITITNITLSANGTTSSTSSSSSTNSSSTGSSTSTAQGSTIFSGSADLGNWSYFTLPAEAFKQVQQGTVLSISTSKSASVPNPTYLNLKLYSANTWQALSLNGVSGASKNGDTLIPQSVNGTVSNTLTATDASNLKANGLIIQGYGLTVNKVTLSNTSATTSTSTSTTQGTTASTPSAQRGSPFAKHGAISVSGANLVDKYGKKFQLYGMSTHGLSWFPEYVSEATFKTLRDDWNTNCVRLVLYPRDYNGYLTGGNQAQLKQIIYNGVDYATKLGMYVIVDWHVHNYNPNETLSEAITFFREISARYKNYDNILYEICNEPVGAEWNSAIKPYAEAVIPVIRANDPNAIVIVGTNTWSQDIEGPSSNPLSYKNVMYTFHFYANTHTEVMRQRVQSAIRSGTPIFITEFGTCDASGNGGFNTAETQKWFNLMKTYNISHMNWSLCNKAETASAIASGNRKTYGWQEQELTDSGRLIRNHFKSLSQ